MIGNAEYRCSCVRYVTKHNNALIVGLSVGLALPCVIIIIIIIYIIYCRRQSKPLVYQDETHTDIEDKVYNRQQAEPAHEVQVLTDLIDEGDHCIPQQLGDYTEDNQDSGYCKQLPDDYTDSGYSRELPDDYTEDNEDSGYSKQLPDYYTDSGYSRQLREGNNEDVANIKQPPYYNSMDMDLYLTSESNCDYVNETGV